MIVSRAAPIVALAAGSVVAPAVPLSVTSPVAKFVTALLNTTVKLIGLVLAGSACPVA